MKKDLSQYATQLAELDKIAGLSPATAPKTATSAVPPELSDEQRKLLEAVLSIPPDAILGGEDESRMPIPAARVIGRVLRHRKSALPEAVGRYMAQAWDEKHNGNAVREFNDADPAYAKGEPLAIGSLFKLATEAGWDGGEAWPPEPQPLTRETEAEPFPIDALPPHMQAAVREVQATVKSPLAMVATSALSALSIAVQGLVNVKRGEKLEGPVSLNTLVFGDSGERKSKTDEFFTGPLRAWDAAQKEANQPHVKSYDLAMDAWNSEREGITAKIKELAKNNKSAEPEKERLMAMQTSKPEMPRIPRLIYGDITSEQLGYILAKCYPIAAVASAEGGRVFGGHSMQGDAAMRSMAMFNALWSGEMIDSDRRTTESWSVTGARCAMNIQIQPYTIREFNKASKGQARGTGLFARFLIAWPESTQGTRFFCEPGARLPALDFYNARIADILAKSPDIDQFGNLHLQTMGFTPEAKAVWVDYHDNVERQLGPSGELFDVRDVASKSAENMARIACLLHVFEHGLGGAIGVEATEAAAQLAMWYLGESRRFFGELAVPDGQIDAIRLDEWLLQRGEATTSTREAQQRGPLRDRKKLDAALMELAELGRVRLVKDGKRKLIEVNPALLKVGR